MSVGLTFDASCFLVCVKPVQDVAFIRLTFGLFAFLRAIGMPKSKVNFRTFLVHMS